jgi:hypothetical protein
MNDLGETVLAHCQTRPSLVAGLRHWPLAITFALWWALFATFYFAGCGAVLFLLLVGAIVFSASHVFVAGLAIAVLSCAFVTVRCFEDAAHEMDKVRL